MVNKVIIIGNLGDTPKGRSTASGLSTSNFPVATSERWKDKEGSPQEKTEWHNVVCFGKLADLCNAHLAKGSKVYVEGSLRTSTWVDKEDKKHYKTEVNASNVKFLSPKEEASTMPAAAESSRANSVDFGDVPF